PNRSSPGGYMPRVLIVEDEPQVLLLAESVLQQAGHETLSAATVAEAQAVIHSGETLHLVFTDLQLVNHVDGGIKIGNLVAQSRPQMPVLYTSGRPVTDGMRALFVGRGAFLGKPYTGDQLLEAVEGLLRTGT